MPVDTVAILAGKAETCATELATPALGNVQISRFSTPKEVEPLWRCMERSGICTAYQRFHWIENWLHTIGKPQDLRAEIVVLSKDEAGLAIFPLALRKRGPFTVLGWLSDNHTNFNMPVMSRSFVEQATSADIEVLINNLPAIVGGCDIIELTSQPRHWAGHVNPVATAGATASHANAYALDLTGGFEATLGRINKSRKRKKFRWQTNKLKDVGGGHLLIARTKQDCNRILDAAFAQMATRFARTGVTNTFTIEGAETFFRETALRSLAQDEPELRLFALEIDGAIRATFAASICKGQMSGCFLSIADDEWKMVSPGEMLLYLVVRQAATEGLIRFDLGRGEERYKLSWCPEVINMADFVKPLSGRAIFLAFHARLKLEVKRNIKSNRTAWTWIKKARARLFGRR